MLLFYYLWFTDRGSVLLRILNQEIRGFWFYCLCWTGNGSVLLDTISFFRNCEVRRFLFNYLSYTGKCLLFTPALHNEARSLIWLTLYVNIMFFKLVFWDIMALYCHVHVHVFFFNSVCLDYIYEMKSSNELVTWMWTYFRCVWIVFGSTSGCTVSCSPDNCKHVHVCFDDRLTLSLLLVLLYDGGWGLSKLKKLAALICGGKYHIFDNFLLVEIAMFYCFEFYCVKRSTNISVMHKVY